MNRDSADGPKEANELIQIGDVLIKTKQLLFVLKFDIKPMVELVRLIGYPLPNRPIQVGSKAPLSQTGV